MYLIVFTIFVILMVLLFYRRERLEYDERYDEFGLLTFDTRSKYEKKIQGLETLVRPIIIELQISSFGDIINEQRQTNYGSKLETVKAKLEEFDKVNPSLTDIFLVRQRKELEEQIEELETEIDKPFTLIEAISIDSPYLDPIKFHTNTLGDIPDLLIKDNELRLQQEKELEESMKSLQAPSAKKETTMEKLMRKQKESTTARKKAQAEAEAKAKSEEEAKVRAQSQSQAIAQAQAIAKAPTQAIDTGDSKGTHRHTDTDTDTDSRGARKGKGTGTGTYFTRGRRNFKNSRNKKRSRRSYESTKRNTIGRTNKEKNICSTRNGSQSIPLCEEFACKSTIRYYKI
jgi:hypothetical protein